MNLENMSLEELMSLREKIDTAISVLNQKRWKSNADKNKTRRAREEYRKETISSWASDHLKPGMIVRVKATSSLKLRHIHEVGSGVFLGRHMSPYDVKQMRPATGSYITDHLMDKILGIVIIENDKPKYVKIMDYIENEEAYKNSTPLRIT